MLGRSERRAIGECTQITAGCGVGTARGGLQEVVLVGAGHGRRARGDAQLDEDVAHVAINGSFAKEQVVCEVEVLLPVATSESTSTSRAVSAPAALAGVVSASASTRIASGSAPTRRK